MNKLRGFKQTECEYTNQNELHNFAIIGFNLLKKNYEMLLIKLKNK